MPTPPPTKPFEPGHDLRCEIYHGDIHCLCAERARQGRSVTEDPPSDSPTPSRYRFRFMNIWLDVYRIAEIVGIRNHAQFHAFKKIIRAGQSVKSIDQDIDEAIAALIRWKEMLNEDRPVQLQTYNHK